MPAAGAMVAAEVVSKVTQPVPTGTSRFKNENDSVVQRAAYAAQRERPRTLEPMIQTIQVQRMSLLRRRD